MNKEKFKVESNKYTVLDAFRFFFFLVITYFAVTIVYMIVMNIVAGAMGKAYADLMATDTAGLMSYIIPSLTFICYFFVYNKIRKVKYRDAISDGQKISLLPISVAIVLAIISIFLFTPFMNLVDYLFMSGGYYADNSIPMQAKMQTSFGYFALGLLIYALLPAIAEELVFRGAVQNALLSKYNGVVAIFFSTIFFVLMHGALQQTVYQAIVGIMLGYLACVGGHICYSIILHFLSNALVLVFGCFDIVAYLNPNNTVYYNIYSMIFPVCIFLLGLVLVGILFWVLKYLRNKNFFRFDSTLTKKKRRKKHVVEEVIEVKKPGFKGMWKDLMFNEKAYMIASIAIIGFIWLFNTVGGFMGS